MRETAPEEMPFDMAVLMEFTGALRTISKSLEVLDNNMHERTQNGMRVGKLAEEFEEYEEYLENASSCIKAAKSILSYGADELWKAL